MSMRTNFRDCKAWSDYGLRFSCPSDTAVKLFDAALTQYIGWYDEPSVGGMEKTFEDMLAAEPTFVMGQVINNGVELMGTGHSPFVDPEFKKALQELEKLGEGAAVSEWERKHVKAVCLFGAGQQKAATLVWEDILVDHPVDPLALKFAHDAYFFLGQQRQMRDSVARVLPHWTDDMPLSCYLPGMHAFGLVETNFYAEAEKAARKGLSLQPRDGWATHALAHVLEVGGRQEEGITFLSSTLKDWQFCGFLACHNFWHWAVYHIEKGEHQGALDIFDAEVGKRVKSGALLDIVDACSLLYRLQLEGVEVGERWAEVHEICKPHMGDHSLVFNDAHFLMAALGVGDKDTTDKFLASVQKFVTDPETRDTDQAAMHREVGTGLLGALTSLQKGEAAAAVELLLPLRYSVVNIGGSDAQRDVFSQLLIHAALTSSDPRHTTLARQLLTERKALKQRAPLTDRLMAKALAAH